MKVSLVPCTEIPELKLIRRGKVRDVYECGENILFVATDRISCFDVVLSDPIPYKGIVLNMLSLFWFEITKDVIKNHFLKTDFKEFKELLPYEDILKNRSMLVKKITPFAFECVVRGYLAGSGWRDYKKNSEISGLRLPSGLKEAQKLAEPIFTPSTKEDKGHDIAVSFECMSNKLGSDLACRIRDKSIELYQFAHDIALEKGIIIADTKFEFGLDEGELILIDEVLTPDSSRFWPQDEYRIGKSQPSFDKQYVRDWLEATTWDKNPPAPRLPNDIINKTSQKYIQAYKMLANKSIDAV